MAEIVYMPKLSDTMTEGVVAAWTKNVGDAVKTGEILAEIETDKATMEFESFYDGVLLYIGVETGKTAPVNAILAIIGDKEEDIASLITATPEAPVISEKKVEEKKEAAPTPLLVQEKAPVAEVKSIPLSSNSGRIFASPLAKKWRKKKVLTLTLFLEQVKMVELLKKMLTITHHILQQIGFFLKLLLVLKDLLMNRLVKCVRPFHGV